MDNTAIQIIPLLSAIVAQIKIKSTAIQDRIKIKLIDWLSLLSLFLLLLVLLLLLQLLLILLPFAFEYTLLLDSYL